MMSASIFSALEVLCLLVNAVALLRLVQVRLFSVYPFFFTFLSIQCVSKAVEVFYGTKSLAFFYCYVWVSPVRNVLYLLVVWELFSVIFRNYAGLRSLSRWVMGVAAAVSPLGLVLSMQHESVYSGHSRWFLPLVVRFERGIQFGMVIFIVIMLYFISRYPIKLPRNNVVLCMLYSVWFLGEAAVLLASSFVPDTYGRRFVNVGMSSIEIACYVGWAFLLSKAGEYQETRVRRDITPEHEKALIGELDAMNELLLRAGRSISHSR
jgi:hypothetical protein